MFTKGQDVDLPLVQPRVLVCDIDGTLTDEKKIISTKAILGLRSIESHGISVILATGSITPVALSLSSFIGTSGPVISEGGGVIDFPQENLSERLADGNRSREAAIWLGKNKPNIDPKGIPSNKWRTTEWCLKPDYDVNEIVRLLAKSPFPDLNVTYTGFGIHLSPPNISKGNALTIVSDSINIPLNQMISVGDNDNDISMFNITGWSIAVGGASIGARNSASFVANKIRGDAVAELCNRLIKDYN